MSPVSAQASSTQRQWVQKGSKAVLFTASLLPAVWLTYGLTDAAILGPNPAERVQLETGIWALRFLVLSLAVTPFRRLTGFNRAIHYRRMLGLFAFFYACLHLGSYVAFDLVFAWDRLPAEILKRPYLAAGMVAFACLVPLALTSTRGWIRRLGRRWQTLHRLAYVSAVAAAIHYLWKVKVMYGSSVTYAAIVAGLLLFRAVWWVRRRALASPAVGS
jgi:sulfoxide reductase heme-binding subunit YedZ